MQAFHILPARQGALLCGLELRCARGLEEVAGGQATAIGGEAEPGGGGHSGEQGNGSQSLWLLSAANLAVPLKTLLKDHQGLVKCSPPHAPDGMPGPPRAGSGLLSPS